MNFDDNITEVFDSYLLGRMSDAEKKEFEARLENDPALKEAFEFHRNIVAGIREARREELKNYIKKNAKISYIGNVWGRNWVYASAAIITIFFGLYFVLQFYNRPTDEKLVQNQTDTGNVATATDSLGTKPAPATTIDDEVAENKVEKDKTEVRPEEPLAVPKNDGDLGEDVTPSNQRKTLPVYAEVKPEVAETQEEKAAAFAPRGHINIDYLPGDKLQYRYNNSGLVLYKVPYASPVWVYMVNNKTYLQYDKAYYNLLKNDKVNDLTPLKDSSVPKELPPLK